MPIVQVRAELNADDLLRVVDQFDPAELERFVQGVLAVKARRQGSALSTTETDLLLKINDALPASVQARYAELIGKRQAQTLSEEEHAELLRLTDESERAEAERARALIELARLRGVSLDSLLHDLGIAQKNDV